MTRLQQQKTIQLIKDAPQSYGRLQLRNLVGCELGPLDAFLKRGEAAGFLRYEDEGCGFRGFLWVQP